MDRESFHLWQIFFFLNKIKKSNEYEGAFKENTAF